MSVVIPGDKFQRISLQFYVIVGLFNLRFTFLLLCWNVAALAFNSDWDRLLESFNIAWKECLKFIVFGHDISGSSALAIETIIGTAYIFVNL